MTETLEVETCQMCHARPADWLGYCTPCRAYSDLPLGWTLKALDRADREIKEDKIDRAFSLL